MASSSKAPLTTNVTGLQDKQKQKQSITNDSRSEQSANISVQDRQSTSSSGFGVETRQLSSNNPYAKIIHAMSPNAEVAVSSPLGHRISAPSLLSVPPRSSSKGRSMPSHAHGAGEVPVMPARPTSAPSQSVPSQPITSSDDQKIWTTNHFSGWRSRTLSYQSDRPNVSPKISIHPNADAILLGDGVVSEDSEVRDQLLAGALPDCTIDNTSTPTQSRNTTEPDTIESKQTSAMLSPIRTMRPSRRPGTAVSPRTPALPIRRSGPIRANRTRPSGKDGAAADSLVITTATDSGAAGKESTSEYASSLDPTEPNEVNTIHAFASTSSQTTGEICCYSHSRKEGEKHPGIAPAHTKTPRWESQSPKLDGANHQLSTGEARQGRSTP
jgi:hypothetical protein